MMPEVSNQADSNMATQIQGMNDFQWTSDLIIAPRSKWTLHLGTRPGIIGGKFQATLEGLPPSGSAQVTISCTAWEKRNSNSRHVSSGPDILFIEVESFEVTASSLEVQFVIPFDAKGSNEGATWELLVELNDGVSEIFEIPVCRTKLSNPEINEVSMASFGIGLDESSDSKSRKKIAQPNSSKQKAYELKIESEKLSLSIPARVPGRISWAKPVGWIWAIWAVVTVAFVFLFDEKLEVCTILGIPLLFMSIVWVFIMFGKSIVELHEDGMVLRHCLFGVKLPNRTPRKEIQGFVVKCVGSLPTSKGSSQAMYVLAAEKPTSSSFLSGALLDRTDARTLAKRLNEFWDISS